MVSRLRVVLLTTETTHHLYFIKRLQQVQVVDLVGVFYEQKHYPDKEVSKKYLKKSNGIFDKCKRMFLNPYSNINFFRKRTESFESYRFFDNRPVVYPKEIPLIHVWTMNEESSISRLNELQPDVCVVFGTGVIKEKVLQIPPKGTINVHRGILPDYKGLDSDLWAIWNGDFAKIGTTIHFVDIGLDTGSILEQLTISLSSTEGIYSLRYYTTVIAADMVTRILLEFQKGEVDSRPQVGNGKYYSFMPYPIKWLTLLKYNRYMRSCSNGRQSF